MISARKGRWDRKPFMFYVFSGLCKLSRLRRLYVNENELDFQGIPPGMGKLGAMEIFSAADNQVRVYAQPPNKPNLRLR